GLDELTTGGSLPQEMDEEMLPFNYELSSNTHQMLSRLATVSMVLILFSRAWAEAEERDYLQRGEEKLTAQYQITYDRATREVLSRGWRRDVVLRMVDIPPFQPEWIAGIARTADGYHASEVTASKHIWAVLDFDNPKKKKRDYRTVRPILH